MSSTEPPSRNSPRTPAHETKTGKDEFTSKGKIEKVREVDPDEETRKQKFQKYYNNEKEEGQKTTDHPSPFDLYAGKPGGEKEGPLAAKAPPAFGDIEDAIIPSPPASPPPDVGAFEGEDPENDQFTEGALPQSEDFWDDYDLPDQPKPPVNLQNNGDFKKKGASDSTDPTPTGGVNSKSAKDAQFTNHKAKKKQEDLLGITKTTQQEKEEKDKLKNKEKPPSLFDPSEQSQIKKNLNSKAPATPKKTPPTEKPLKPEELVQATSSPPKKTTPTEKLLKPEEIVQAVPVNEKEERLLQEQMRGTAKDKRKDQTTKQTAQAVENLSARPPTPEQREGGAGKDKKGQGQQGIQIESPGTPALPTNVQPMATAAAVQATPFLSPATIPLFFQMVGMMYIMEGPKGISRTEVVLNNPSFSNSKFYGSTIIIEKYATAPDSFNIRLMGSPEAVTSFKQSIPSLMSAFANGNYAFKVARIDVEHRIEKPMFHRKERSSDQGDAGGGDLGERRK